MLIKKTAEDPMEFHLFKLHFEKPLPQRPNIMYQATPIDVFAHRYTQSHTFVPPLFDIITQLSKFIFPFISHKCNSKFFVNIANCISLELTYYFWPARNFVKSFFRSYIFGLTCVSHYRLCIGIKKNIFSLVE